jgi:hypothetical protein
MVSQCNWVFECLICLYCNESLVCRFVLLNLPPLFFYLLASFLANYSVLDVASLDWDFDDDLDLEGATSPSVLARCKPQVVDDDDVSLVGISYYEGA